MRLKLRNALILTVLCLGGCFSGNNKAVLDGYSGFNCPAPNKIKYEPWGENGLSKSCVNSQGQSDGSFWAAEMGKFFFRGYYKDGNASGTWEYVDKNGNVIKKVMGN